MRDKLIVIGNGPSLLGFDLRRLNGADTLGMNAAYRHWDRSDWYPDLYVCLDDELINTHWKEIRTLVDTGRVKQAFLSGHFLTFVPEVARDARYRFLDNYVEYWYATRGKAFGLERIVHPAFSTSNPDKLTTGSYAVRFGIACGYTNIALMGIDLKYIEQIAGARSTGGNRLEIVETPLPNPNYCFDDYQRAGNAFQVPNPAVHNGDLHLASFRALRDDAVSLNYNVEIVNTNLQSALHEQGVLPYQALEDFLNRPVLGAIVVPTMAREIDAILDNLWLWDQPSFAPFLHMQNRQAPRLVYCFNNETGRSVEPEIRAAFEKSEIVKRSFAGLEFRYLSLHGEDDLYARDSEKPVGAKGYRAGPNNQFLETIASAADLGRFIFYMETDCVPIRVDWLGRLQDLLRNTEPFWVMGSIYRGDGLLWRSMARHINGNAIYAAGDRDFQDFVASVWRPELEHLAARDPIYAYDMVPETIFEGSQSNVLGDANWRLLQATAHKFRYTDIIRNYAGPARIADSGLIRQILRESPMTCLVHGREFWMAVRKLKAESGVPIAATFLQWNASPDGGGSEKTGDGVETVADASAPADARQEEHATPGPQVDIGSLESRVAALEFAVVALDADASPYRRSHRPPNYGIASEMKRRYWQVVRDIHEVVSSLIPRDATVLIVSRGDDLLLNLDGRRAWHFPRAFNGAYAGRHPADSGAAIAELEALRAQGADFLIVPNTAFWWFSYYHEFKQHLDSRYVRLETPDCCAIYRLSTVAAETGSQPEPNSTSSAN